MPVKKLNAPGAAAGGCACCAACCCCIGIILLIAGATAQSSAEGLDPDADFEEIGRCRITASRHQATYEEENPDDGVATCLDVYRYTFFSIEESSTHTSREERVVRFERRASEVSRCSGDPRPGTYSVGDVTACWKPRELPVRDEYRCGSDECVKIFDPQQDADEAMEAAGGLLAVGLGFLITAIFMCCTCVAGLACLSAHLNRMEDMHQHQGGATVVQPHRPPYAGAPTVVQGTVVGVPQTQPMQVVLPPGTMPGQPFTVQTPDGRQVSVLAPQNALPGQTVQIQV